MKNKAGVDNYLVGLISRCELGEIKAELKRKDNMLIVGSSRW